jgi:hypothetical protein
MDPIVIIESAKKHGISVLLIFALVWMNNRLSNVEEKLYDCLEDRAQFKSAPVSEKHYKHIDPIYAILPDKLKVKCSA